MAARPLRLTAELLSRLHAEPPFELRLGDLPEAALVVHSFRGSERLSGMYRFDIDVTTALEDDFEERLLAQPARLALRHGGVSRRVHGLVTRARLVRLHPQLERAQYRLRIEPRLSLLRHRHGSRIFQDQTLVEVVTEVLGEARIRARWVLTGSYPKRPYLTQYEESDWDLVRRLLAEAGMFFGFPDRGPATVADDEEQLFVGDSPAAYVGIDQLEGVEGESLPYLGGEDAMTSASPGILTFELARAVGIHRATYREHDPDRPGALLEREARIADHPGEHVPEHAGLDLEHYGHHGETWYPDWDAARDEPRRLLRERRRRCALARGTGTSLALIPGHRFHLVDHPLARLNQELVVTKVEHRGWADTDEERPRLYESAFECVPAHLTHAPKRKGRRRALVALTATVVGPGKDDIHVDGQGRIKVRFHWDRRPTGQNEDTCWLRTMQAWSGGSFGTQFIPRVGMEVVVSFEGGDPDKPLVLGCVYNGSSPLPFPTPADKTRSGIRTQSSVRGSGYNELSFQDRDGQEQIYLHAQRDLDEEVGNDRHVQVVRDDALHVIGTRTTRVGVALVTEVSGTYREQIGGELHSQVVGSRLEHTTGNVEQSVEGNLQVQVTGRRTEDLQQPAATTFHGDHVTRTYGSHTVIVGRTEAERSYALHVEGRANQHATRSIELTSDREIVFRCGQATLRLSPERIDLEAPTVALQGQGPQAARLGLSEEGLRLAAEGIVAQLADRSLVLENDQGASLAIGREILLDAVKILLNSPARATEELAVDATPPTMIELVDQAGNALPGQRYIIRLEDGSEIAGRLDDQGKARRELPCGGFISFPDLTEVAAL